MIRCIITGPGVTTYGTARAVKYPYIVRAIPGSTEEVLQGVSEVPLLDACRRLNRMGIADNAKIGLFDLHTYTSNVEARLVTTVGYGARLGVKDQKGTPTLKKNDPTSKSVAFLREQTEAAAHNPGPNEPPTPEEAQRRQRRSQGSWRGKAEDRLTPGQRERWPRTPKSKA